MADATPESLTTSDAAATRQRIPGIDAGRFLMAFLVVTLHSLPRDGSAAAIVGMACRCAVPFFLIAAGYLQSPRQRFTAEVLTRPLARLFPIYVFWMLVYYAVAYFGSARPVHLDLRDLVSGGTAFHLWFLPALGVALVLVPAGVVLLGSRATGLLCVALAAAGVASSTYHDLLQLPGSARRGGLMVAPLFVYIGYWLAGHKVALAWPAAAALAATGLAVMLGEEHLISHRLGLPLDDHDFSIGTFAYGAGIFLLARALPPSAAVDRLASLGPYALGIYVTHVLFVWGLAVASPDATLAALPWRAPLVFACALLLTAVLRRLPFMRRTVA